MPEEHPKQLRRAVETYPDDEDWILPTRFGNAFRAVEVYPRVIYGLDAVPLWPRLQAVLPQQFRDTLEESKAQLDFCLNIMLSAVCITLAYAALALWYQHLPICWIPIIGTLIAAIGYLLALSAVGQYGLYLKSAFDLYRQELAEQLGYELPQSIVGEREMWQALSRMMIYRSSARAEQVVKFRALERKP